MNKWPLSAEFFALGHTLQDNGSTQTCWQRTSRSMWKAYFGNCASKVASRMPEALRYTLMDRAVLPTMQHRDTRWPPTALRQMQIDTIQRKMVCSIMRLRPHAHEGPVEYVRRRNRQATTIMGQRGRWSVKHCKRVVAWDAHLQRPRNSCSWAAILLKFRDSKWLEARRLQNSAGFESRTRTRVARSFVAMRWQDGVSRAAQQCPR